MLQPEEEEGRPVEEGEGIGWEQLMHRDTDILDGGESLPAMPEGLPAMPEGLPAMPEGLPTMPESLPAMLEEAIRNLGQRSPPEQVQQVIAELCNIRPYTADELATIIKRNKKWIFRSYLSPMIKNGTLEYLFPSNPRHPMQAYRTKK